MQHHSVVHKAAGTANAAYAIALACVLGYHLATSVWDDVQRRREQRKNKKNLNQTPGR